MALFVYSCSNDDDSYLQDVHPPKMLSGTLTYANSPDTIEIGDKQIILSIGNDNHGSMTRTASANSEARGQITNRGIWAFLYSRNS